MPEITSNINTSTLPNEESGTEKGSGIVQKDVRELLYQLSLMGNIKLANELVADYGYDEQKIREELEKIAEQTKGIDEKSRDYYEGYDYFLSKFRQGLPLTEKSGGGFALFGTGITAGVKAKFDEYVANHQDEEQVIEEKRKLLEKRIYRLDSPNNSAEIQKTINEAFPSGNYLVHGALVENALAVVDDGSLKSVAAIRKKDPKFKGHAGEYGVSFSMNGVGVLPITFRHAVMFVASPEAILDSETKLTVPYMSGENEVQVVPSDYLKEAIGKISATAECLGIKEFYMPITVYGYDGNGAVTNFKFLKLPSDKRKVVSRIEEDLQRLKTGNISQDDIRNLYSYEDNKFRVSPAFVETGICGGTVFADYLLRFTKEGQSLGKTLQEVTSEELSKLYEEARTAHIPGIPHDFNREWLNVQEGLSSDSEKINFDKKVSLPIENMVMMIPDKDLPQWMEVLTRSQHLPKALVLFDWKTGPRVINWDKLEGHKDRAQQVVESTLEQCHVQKPSLPYPSIFAQEQIYPEDFHDYSTIHHLKWNVVKKSKEVVKTESGEIKII